MPSDILQIDLRSVDHAQLALHPNVVRYVDSSVKDLADAYFRSYPPGIAAATVQEAQLEIQQMVANEFGTLVLDACFVVQDEHSVVGGIFVVEYSLWDEGLEGPFIVDLFLAPEYRQRGLGRAMVVAVVNACRIQGGTDS